MNNAGAFFVRWRVRLGYPLAVLILWFARPSFRSIVLAMPLGLIGLALRAFAAGYLHKQEVLTVSGPYAYTRNPLYFGSAILALAVGVATHSWISAAILCAYFAVFYSVVMRREEQELRRHHGAVFEEYANAVPLFFPRLTPAHLPSAGSPASFSLAQYRKNHEYQAAIGFVLLLLLLLLIWLLRPR